VTTGGTAPWQRKRRHPPWYPTAQPSRTTSLIQRRRKMKQANHHWNTTAARRGSRQICHFLWDKGRESVDFPRKQATKTTHTWAQALKLWHSLVLQRLLEARTLRYPAVTHKTQRQSLYRMYRHPVCYELDGHKDFHHVYLLMEEGEWATRQVRQQRPAISCKGALSNQPKGESATVPRWRVVWTPQNPPVVFRRPVKV
jgi:hypothetical protein